MTAAATIQQIAAGRFAADVAAGLAKTPRQLPSEYLYDAIGTALFETITLLPEYGLTRADERVIARLASKLPASYRLVAELGCGSGAKARLLLEALRPETYFPIDVSRSALASTQRELQGPWSVSPLEGGYLDGLARAAASRRPGQRLLVLFLGSTVGNFHPGDRQDFLASIRALLSPDDALLIGFDLVKPTQVLLDAYDDPAGVTAAFNLNLLARANRELGANFNLRNFTHLARYDARRRRVEMHLKSKTRQRVRIPCAAFGCTLEASETIWTESSYKFQPDQPARIAREAGFEWRRDWADETWPFAESLWTVPATMR